MFEHCSVIWRPHNITTINKLENVQKRAIKWILNEDYKSYSDLDYLLKCKQLNFFPLDIKFLFNDLLFLHKIINNMIPIRLPHYLHFFNGNYRLRSCHLDHRSLISDIKPKVYAKYTKNDTSGRECKIFENSYFYRSHLAWNRLPINLRDTIGHHDFKSKLRKHLWGEALSNVLISIRDNM